MDQQLRKGNIQVVYCSTTSNYFHALRRQLHRDFRKPLIAFNSKKLLKFKGVPLLLFRPMSPWQKSKKAPTSCQSTPTKKPKPPKSKKFSSAADSSSMNWRTNANKPKEMYLLLYSGCRHHQNRTTDPIPSRSHQKSHLSLRTQHLILLRSGRTRKLRCLELCLPPS